MYAVLDQVLARARQFGASAKSVLLAGLLFAGLLLSTPGAALAQTEGKTKVAVLPFNGPAESAQRARAQAIKALQADYEIVPQETWDMSATKLVATSRSADDLAAVAGDLGVQVIVTGAIKRDPTWLLVLSIRQGATGQSLEKLRYPLRSTAIPAQTLRAITTDLPPLVAKVAAEPVAPPPPIAMPETTPPPPEVDASETESPFAPKKKPEERKPQRPPWAPYIEGSLAFELSGRRFAFEQPNLPEFRSVLAPGLRIDVNVYPLAGYSLRQTAGWNALQGLGVGATLDLIFWPDSIPCPTRDAQGNCAPRPDRYPTSERRIETGLRWHWNIRQRVDRPDLLVSAQYGQHDFSIAKLPDGSDVGPPDVSYRYITLGIGTRAPVHPRVALVGGFNYHVVLSTGAIQTNRQYGPGGAYGLRVHGGGEVRLWRALALRLVGFYERFRLSFDFAATDPNTGIPVKSTTGGATDQYYGLHLGVGCSF